ncbi:MAG TPA: L,D-transpeptidase/peptidoglycan binding protein [Candidatus Dormibacteraeota bacterium]|nr:L,D-transpeptidase/peptidoglycan binding protein [Candidatus Dormibacteraeota bacterium]
MELAKSSLLTLWPEIKLRLNRHTDLVRKSVLVAGAIMVAAFSLQLGLSAAYAGKIYPGVKLSGISVGGMTRHQAEQRLLEGTSSYTIKIEAAGRKYQITAEELGASYDVGASVESAYLVGRNGGFLPWELVQQRTDRDLRYAYRLNQAAKSQLVAKIVQETGVAPIDAAIVIKGGKPEIQPDKDGKAINASDMERLLESAVANPGDQLISIIPTIQAARIQEEHVKPVVDQTQKLLAVPIKITHGDKSFSPSPADIGEWITYEKALPAEQPGLKPQINADKVRFYLQSVANAIYVKPVNKKIRIENGVSSEERAGTDGLMLNEAPVVEAIIKSLSDQKALAMAAPTKPVAYKTEYSRVTTLDGQYIEINLSSQRLWAYDNHKLVFETPITSGATGAGFPTVQGMFAIYNKQTNRNLNGYAIGYDYNVFVKYWMPFHADYGLHDASWRSQFGGSDYYYGGSHGCVNMPEAAAAFLFGWAPVGTPVWIHS